MSEPQFLDAESFGGGFDDKFSFKFLVLEHLRRIATLSTKEFRGGYWVDKDVGQGGQTLIIHTYIPDSREEYSNAIDYLYDVLFPHFDDKFREEEEDFEVWKIVKDTELLEKFATDDKEKGVKVWTKKKAYVFIDQEQYKTEVVKVITRKLFRMISSFLYRENYLNSQRFEE